MEIEKMELKELKAIAYDVLASIQKLQNDLVAINNAIIQKQGIPETPQKTPENKEKEK